MDKNIYKAKWKQMRGKSKIWRGKINRHRMDQLSGQLDVMVGKWQERYSIARHKAARGIERRKLGNRPGLLHRRSSSKS